MISKKLLVAILLCPFLLSGCAQYVITQELEQPIPNTAACAIGNVTDELPLDMDEADKPTSEDIEKLKGYLVEEINKKEIFSSISAAYGSQQFEIRGGILEFKRGSGFVRFLGLFGAGNAYITVSLNLVDLSTGQIVFGGNFKGQVSSYMEAGQKMYQNVSKNFASALKKRIKALKG
jgi:PBP1b-binding outer membrane lipoprotein LpoB